MPKTKHNKPSPDAEQKIIVSNMIRQEKNLKIKKSIENAISTNEARAKLIGGFLPVFYNTLLTNPETPHFIYNLAHAHELEILRLHISNKLYRILLTNNNYQFLSDLNTKATASIIETLVDFYRSDYILDILFHDKNELTSMFEQFKSQANNIQKEIISLFKPIEENQHYSQFIKSMTDEIVQSREEVSSIYEVFIDNSKHNESFENYKKEINKFLSACTLETKNIPCLESQQSMRLGMDLIRTNVATHEHWIQQKTKTRAKHKENNQRNLALQYFSATASAFKNAMSTDCTMIPLQTYSDLIQTIKEYKNILTLIDSKKSNVQKFISASINEINYHHLTSSQAQLYNEAMTNCRTCIQKFDERIIFIKDAIANLLPTKKKPALVPEAKKIAIDGREVFINACKAEKKEEALAAIKTHSLNTFDCFTSILAHGDIHTLKTFLDQYSEVITIPNDIEIQKSILQAASGKFKKAFFRITDLSTSWSKELANQFNIQKESKKSNYCPAVLFQPAADETDLIETKASSTTTASSITTTSIFSMDSPDPRPKLEAFLSEEITNETKNNPILKEAQCYALSLLLIQYFQAYKMTDEDRIAGLTLVEAGQLRDALVHQHNNRSRFLTTLLSSGKEKSILEFAKLVVETEKTGDATQLKLHPYFKKVLTQGERLEEQKDQGTLEKKLIQFKQRVIYTRFLNDASSSFAKLKSDNATIAHMIDHAKGMLGIFRQLYCIKQSGNDKQKCEAQEARLIRHSDFTFSEARKSQLALKK